ncbi:FKBP-type peptidyl-prolyl cis-trans isomerase [Pedobacter sp. Du54]|uniref:FKBP-type peptidyl-prolyl cis-trans isomerase n=1 Tax=Pedobacter anseongensis TaxID=3133439 RepID=UPI0030A7E94E
MQIHKKSKKYIVALVAILFTLSSCEKTYESIESIDDAKIKDYIQKNNIPAVKDPSGFYYQVLDQGTGGALLNKDSVFYTSTVKSLTGTSYYSPSAYTNDANYLGYVNPAAYRTAMLSINRGGKVRVIVPSYLAFGKNGQDNIPPNEVVVAEISVYPQTAQWQVDDKHITDFIAAKGLTGFTKHPSRVYQSVSVAGTGPSIKSFSTITVKYTGRLLNGTIFDQSGTTDLVSSLSDLVPGWIKSLPGITKGSKLRLLIPSDLGYGKAGNGIIPGNAILDFDIEIVDVVD